MSHAALALFVFFLSIPTAFAASVNFNRPQSIPESPARKPVLIFGVIPLMPALTLLTPEELDALGKARERHVLVAQGPVDVDSVYYFYQDQLQSLGWKPLNARSYEKAPHRLDIQAQSSNNQGQTLVTFRWN